MPDPTRIVELLLSLAAVDGPSGREADVAEAVRGRLAGLSIPAAMDGAGAVSGGSSGNLIARIPGTLAAPTLLLCAHLDTVLPTRGLKAEVGADGLIRSDGSTILGADDRAGIAIILEILQQLRERRLPHGPLELLFTVSEEDGMKGAKALAIGELQAAFGLVFDSSAPCGSYVVEAPGAAAFEAVIQGRAAHAAIAPEAGVHAIRIAAEAIARMELGRWGGTGMLNVGTIRGGTAINVIPDRVELQGETRSPSTTGLQAQMDHVRDALEGAARQAGGSVSLRWIPKYRGFSLAAQAPIVAAVRHGVAEAGFEPRPLSYPGGSDANVLNERGIACVNLGIGCRNVHSLQEAMPVQSLVDSVRIGLEIIRAVAAPPTFPERHQP
jgi:tripeptide aminopeptidase